MKPGIPWSVKGIEQQAREAAKQAARQSGMTIGEWLNSVILDSADGDDLERRYRRPAYRPKPVPGTEQGEGEEVTLRLEEIAEQLHSLARHESDTALSRHAGPEDENRLRAIVERLDAHEQRTSSVLEAMQERLDELARQPDRAHENRVPQRPDDVPGYRALEGALRNIIEHIEISETRTRDAIRSLQEQLTEQAAGTGTTQPNDLGEVRETEQRLRGLVEEARQAGDSITAGAGASQHDINQLRLEIEQLATTVSQASGHAVSDLSERMQRIESDLKHQLSDRDEETRREVAALGQRLAATERRLEHLATIEESVAQLARSLKQDGAAASQRSTGPSPELKALEAGLNAVRASAEIADRRTQETLQAVHETLEHIIGKLAELDADDSSDGEETAEAPVVEPAAEPVDELSPDELSPEPAEMLTPEPADEASPEPVEETAEHSVAPVEAEAEPESAAIDAEMAPVETPADDGNPEQPDEETFVYGESAPTGDNEPGGREEPRMEAAEETPHTGFAAPSAPADQPVREDYIAAARRAAQMAASRNRNPVTSGFNKFSQHLSGAGRRSEKPAEGSAPKRGLMSSLLAGLRGRKTDASGEARPDSKGKRKRLIFLGLVLLAAASAYGAQRHVASVPGFGLGAALLGPDEPASTDVPLPAAATARDALTMASLAPAPEPARRSMPVSLTLPTEIGPESLRQAAIGGDANAQFIVAGRYLEGTAVPRNEEKAAEWYALAASQGLPVAQYRLGSMYEHGRGRPLDHKEARAWYEQAAGHGNINAMHNLAVLYIEPRTGKRQYELAATWFRKAAERGLKDSQFNLAVLHEQGLGMVKKPEEAVFWYSLAAVQGDREAASKAKALEALLPPETVKQVHGRLLAWRPLPADRNANIVPLQDPSWHGMS